MPDDPVSQSGETADTLAALREGRERGAWVLSVCNTRESTIARESHDVLYTHAGPEIGVASTKCFTTPVRRALSARAEARCGTKDDQRRPARRGDRRTAPAPAAIAEETLQLDDQIKAVAQRYFRATNFLFLGRGVMYPIALEGALKLKEISYIHAEGYAAGEMKHGPIALIDEHMPVVVMANQSSVYEKVVSNLEQVRARAGQVIAIASAGDAALDEKADAVIRIPELGEFLTALIATIPVEAPRLPRGDVEGHGRRPAAQPREERDGRIDPGAPAPGLRRARGPGVRGGTCASHARGGGRAADGEEGGRPECQATRSPSSCARTWTHRAILRMAVEVCAGGLRREDRRKRAWARPFGCPSSSGWARRAWPRAARSSCRSRPSGAGVG